MFLVIKSVKIPFFCSLFHFSFEKERMLCFRISEVEQKILS